MLQEGRTGHFSAEEIVKIIFQKYFNGKRSKGNQDPGFLDKINAPFLLFVCCAIRHCLMSWRQGALQTEKVNEFKYQTAWCE